MAHKTFEQFLFGENRAQLEHAIKQKLAELASAEGYTNPHSWLDTKKKLATMFISTLHPEHERALYQRLDELESQ